MDNWQIVLIIGEGFFLLIFVFCLVAAISEWRSSGGPFLWWFPIVGVLFIPVAILDGCFRLFEYLVPIVKDGGFIRHHIKEKKRAEKGRAQKEEEERIKHDLQSGKIKRKDLPRATDGITLFEFNADLGFYDFYYGGIRNVIYVENEYCASLNDFFIRNKELPKYNVHKLWYLPTMFNNPIYEGLLGYKYPDIAEDEEPEIMIDSTYPIKYLCYPEDAEKIRHGMMFFFGLCNNHGVEYITGHYYPLEEGSDNYVLAQLDTIVQQIHHTYWGAGLFCKAKRPNTQEGSTNDYADELFPWVVNDDEIAILVKEVRDRIEKLKEKGLADKLLLKLIQTKPKLSRLVITKDMRIILPDYQMMEIKMEPINKAVYLLFLRHPEGIIFKHLPDYRKELAEIYQMIKPFGLTDRAIRSIEDVTNPCLNSINEKCARIRGAFISQFDESLAQHYYIYGERGEAKKISLSRDLVTWE